MKNSIKGLLVGGAITLAGLGGYLCGRNDSRFQPGTYNAEMMGNDGSERFPVIVNGIQKIEEEYHVRIVLFPDLNKSPQDYRIILTPGK